MVTRRPLIALALGLLGQALAQPTGLRADDIDSYTCGAVAPADQAPQSSGSLVAVSPSVDVRQRPALTGDVFFSLFQTHPSGRWSGNVKKLKIAALEVADPNSAVPDQRYVVVQPGYGLTPQPALSDADGGIAPDALTYWTDPTGADVLAFNPERGEVAGRDGRAVRRGGAGQQIPGLLSGMPSDANHEPHARQLFTQDPRSPDALLPLDADSADLALLSPYLDPHGVFSAVEHRRLLQWIRGRDVFDADGDGNAVETHDWLLGDVLHSRPLVINYGARPGSGYTAGNPDIRLFFGSNDGIFHMLRNTEAGGGESGRESWAFLPLELLPLQAALAGRAAPPVPGHIYGMDGAPVALVDDSDGNGVIERSAGDRAWVFIGQRRGGRGIYAFDMTDPDAPALKWKITGDTPGFGQLALTFSTPAVARLDLGGTELTPALVFGGGYRGGWQGSTRLGKDAGDADDTVGNAIYVVDTDTGRLIWKAVGPDGSPAPADTPARHFAAGLTDSIPSPVAVVDSDGNGIADRAYVGDTGGTLWRINLGEAAYRAPDSEVTDNSNWYLRELAQLGGSGAQDRRFFHAPDVVRTRDAAGEYTGVVIVSGNRAAPGDVAVRNYAYLIKDRAPALDRGPPLPPVAHRDLADVTHLCTPGAATACAAPDLYLGWKLALEGAGEKGLSRPLVSSGTALFTTYLPAAPAAGGACRPGMGQGRAYAVRLEDGAPAPRVQDIGELELAGGRATAIGSGMPAELLPLDNQLLVPGSGLDGRHLFAVPGGARWRVYWREDGVDRF
ncbi:MAG: hypothetical protein KDI16_12780 [Halioglobus sp.]|nr:hypothetical protein [Halioglobus sp.]